MPLLKRATVGSTLTAQGTVLVHWARKIIDDTAQMLDVASGLHTDHTAEMTVGASMTVAEHLLPRWLGVFRARFPEVTVHLRVLNSSTVFVSLANDACDVGFVESPTVPSTLCDTVVARDRLVLVVPPDHPWTRRRRKVTAEELAATPLLVREPGSGTRITLDEALAGYARADPILELGSSAAIRTSVAAGVGPAVLSTLAIADEARSGAVRPVEVDGLDLTRRLRAVWRPPRELRGPAAELVRIARKSTP
ncbi:LysR family transcriptional regulator [Gordonia humi]